MKLLFVCVGNSCRSQMAEGFARAAGHEAASAGTVPSPGVHPDAIKVMAEVGIDIAAHEPKMLDWDTLDTFDRTITMGCNVAESCPTLRTDEDWGIDDPVGGPLDGFRAARDIIAARVAALGRSEG